MFFQLKQVEQIAGKKYIGKDGLSFGIDDFGKSAPYEDIYNHFGLSVKNISSKIKNFLRR
jgi:transketolase